jgi:hypothetical protein
MAVRLSALRAGSPLPAGRFLVLNSVKRLSRPQGPSSAGRIRLVELPNDLIGNRSRDLTACSTVSQSTIHVNINSVLLFYLTTLYQLHW